MFTVLHSSAGAGKTHALVKHYLEHCLATDDVAAYRQVLALTFTNKAAGEMKERVISYLEKLGNNEIDTPPLRDVMDHLVLVAQVDEPTLALRGEAVLSHMLHHWSEVAISTIDAFTRRVVRPFARDLQLDQDLHMTTEERYYRDRAVDTLIGEAGVDPKVTSLLTEACLQLLHEERAWDPGGPLRELSGELAKESAIKPLQALRALSAEEVAPLAAQLRKETGVFRKRLNTMGDEALQLIVGAGVVAEDMANGKGGIFGWFKKLAEFETDWITPGPNALKPLESGKWHSGKAGPDAIATLRSVAPNLERLFQEAESLRAPGQKDYFIRRAVLRELYPAFALHELDGQLEALKRADAVAFFSDLTRRVAQVVKDEPVPFIYERMGERYHHFLIDEFQDTSLLQWSTLLPLIDNALSTGGSTLLVGDAKQAIYRWRNGEVRLFSELPKVFGREDSDAEREREDTLIRNFKKGEPLDMNRRSAATIIEFNNNLFASLARLLPADLQKVYDAHEQRTPNDRPGLVQLDRLDKDLQGGERDSAVLDFTLRGLNEAIADGFVPGDVAVLVRSKILGRAVAGHLMAHGFAVVSPDGLRLSGDPVIELHIDLLRFMHTGDATAAARVAQYQAMLGSSDPEHVDPFAVKDGLPDPAGELRQWMDDNDLHGLRTTLTDLVTRVAHAHGLKPSEDAQLLTLLDEVHAWTTEHGPDIGAFLEHWERSGGERGSAPPVSTQAVQVMTVHKAKGLEFPVVIVPNTNMTGGGNHAERLWVRPGSSVPGLDIALVRESKALREAGLEEITEEAGLRTLDSLNLLYVAFTRPVQRLYALVPEARPDEVTKAALAFMDEHGSDGTLIDGDRGSPWKVHEEPQLDMLREVASATHALPITIRLEAPDEWDPADPDPYRSFGNAVHELLGRVKHADDLEVVIADAVNEGLLDASAADAFTRRIAPMMKAEALAPWYGPGLDVRNEATIITRDGRSLRPDRVVFDGPKVRVLDIKTGAPHDSHRDQVLSYMHLLNELGHTDVEGALLYVRDGSLQPVEA
ncbi:MAG: UvrD-helicase domain-containing protein [Flavobacteriales bacterium]